MCEKAISKDSYILKYSLNKYEIQKMCKNAVSKDCFTVKYCPYRHIAKEICEKAIDAYILTSKFVLDWFVTPKMLKTFAYCLFVNNLDSEYDCSNSDDDPVVNLDDYSDYNKIRKLFYGSMNTIVVKNTKMIKVKSIIK